MTSFARDDLSQPAVESVERFMLRLKVDRLVHAWGDEPADPEKAGRLTFWRGKLADLEGEFDRERAAIAQRMAGDA